LGIIKWSNYVIYRKELYPKKHWWIIGIVILHIGGGLCGSVSGAAIFRSIFGTSAVPPYLQPSNLNSINTSWGILTTTILYLLLFMVQTSALSYTTDPIGAFSSYSTAFFVVAFSTFTTTRTLPSLGLNIALGYASGGVYDTLWVDVVGALIAMVLAFIFWWTIFQPFFGHDNLSVALHNPVRVAKQEYNKVSGSKRARGMDHSIRNQTNESQTNSKPMSKNMPNIVVVPKKVNLFEAHLLGGGHSVNT